MRGQNNEPRKRRTREHVIADLGVNHVERQVLRAGHTVEKQLHDYGLDLTLNMFDRNGEILAGSVFFQVKSTDHLEMVQNGRYISCRIERAHLRAWLAEPMPVVLIVYDAKRNRAYWLYVQAAFSAGRRFRAVRGSDRLTLHVPVNQVFTLAALRRIDRFRENIEAQTRDLYHHD